MKSPRIRIHKSVDGFPEAISPPPGIDLAKEARTARSRLYPITILYIPYCLTILSLALRRSVPTTLAFMAVGLVFWSGIEYWIHRYLLHAGFPDGPGFWEHNLHRIFDTMHSDHHQRPWDGMYINGHLETLPLSALLVALSSLFPLTTAPVAIAIAMLGYLFGEWVHYFVHFPRFHWRYLEYIRRHHLYHHSPHGKGLAYGLSNGVWDVIVRTTRIPTAERVRLHGHAAIWWRLAGARAATPRSDSATHRSD